eukprot:9674220-Alexandrium_andersonii.AAC.1
MARPLPPPALQLSGQRLMAEAGKEWEMRGRRAWAGSARTAACVLTAGGGRRLGSGTAGRPLVPIALGLPIGLVRSVVVGRSDAEPGPKGR